MAGTGSSAPPGPPTTIFRPTGLPTSERMRATQSSPSSGHANVSKRFGESIDRWTGTRRIAAISGVSLAPST